MPEFEFPEVDLSQIDFNKPVATIEQIRQQNPHRYEFELITAVVMLDTSRHVLVGYKDCSLDEYWVRGHMPGYPLLPGVLMCEAAAQMCNYYVKSQGVIPPENLMGLGGLEEARFVRPVRPGERLVMIGHGEKVHRRMNKFRVKGFVGNEPVFEVLVVGINLGKYEELKGA